MNKQCGENSSKSKCQKQISKQVEFANCLLCHCVTFLKLKNIQIYAVFAALIFILASRADTHCPQVTWCPLTP